METFSAFPITGTKAGDFPHNVSITGDDRITLVNAPGGASATQYCTLAELFAAMQSSITGVGTLTSGAVPASLITAGTFGAGAYTFPGALAITGALSGVTTLATSSTINGQTISSAANFTGTITTASTLNTGADVIITTASGTANRTRLVQTGVVSWYLRNSATTGLFALEEAGVADWFTVAKTTGAATFAGTLAVTGGFGCNTKAAQAAYASGGALNAYGAGANGLDSGANMSALHAMVVSIRAALVADGIMS